MTRVMALCALLLAGANLPAQQFPDWLLDNIREDTETPETLPWFMGVGTDCPYSMADLEPVMKGVIVRSRIKAVNAILAPTDFSIVAHLNCIDSTPFVYSLTVQFALRTGYRISYDFGSFGTLKAPPARSEIERVVKEGVERAMTAYLKANFDL